MGSRIQKLAKNVIEYSLDVQLGENVLIQSLNVKDEYALSAFIEEIHNRGGHAFVDIADFTVRRKLQMKGTEEQFKLEARLRLERMKEMDAVLLFLGEDNLSEFSDVPAEQSDLYQNIHKPVNDEMMKKKWVILNYPTKAYAQMAEMSMEAYTDFLFKTCSIDYSKMSKAMDALVDKMNRTEQVRIVAPNTDLSFSIKGMPAIKCDGKINLPDGEVFTAPILDSVNGTITFNTKSIYRGHTFQNISLSFKNGKVIDFSSDNNEKLRALLDSDEGSRFIGEFAIGVNPYINRIMNDIGFDEKINGSIHFALGEAYEVADNGNKSTVHWDIVQLHKPEYGGGEIYFDNTLISKDGLFVIEELIPLNPENLL